LLFIVSVMNKRLVASLVVGAALVAFPGVASAAQVPTWNPAVLCVPSAEEEQGHGSLLARYINEEPLCLVRIPPLFAGTSFELAPKATKKRWGASLELKF
jgi:hypothetical protein